MNQLDPVGPDFLSPHALVFVALCCLIYATYSLAHYLIRLRRELRRAANERAYRKWKALQAQPIDNSLREGVNQHDRLGYS